MNATIFDSRTLSGTSGTLRPRGRADVAAPAAPAAPARRLHAPWPPRTASLAATATPSAGSGTTTSSAPASTSSIWSPPVDALPARPPARASSWSASTDIALIAIIEAPLAQGETAAVGFTRKEAELRHAMAMLGVLESRALHSRLSYPKAGDPLAAAFMRLTAERRARLINFLADARRREALARR